MSDIETRLREQRTIEAVRKNLMGLNGKIGCVVRNLGQPLYGHSTDGYSFSSETVEHAELDFRQSPAELQSSIPYLDTPEGEPTGNGWRDERGDDYSVNSVASNEMGWHFDALSSGIHLEIKYIADQRDLSVLWKGYPVYREVTGELAAYFPHDEWEGKIDQLFVLAKAKERRTNIQTLTERKKQSEENRESLLQRMRKKWGL